MLENAQTENKSSLNRLRTVLHVIDLISEWSGKVASFAIVFLIGIIVWAVILRYFFNTVGSWEFFASSRFLPLYVCFGGAYTLLKRGHVGTDLLTGRLSLRTRSILELFTALLFFFFCYMLLYEAIPSTLRILPRLRWTTNYLNPGVWPMPLLTTIGIALLPLQGIAKFIRDFYSAITGKVLK